MIKNALVILALLASNSIAAEYKRLPEKYATLLVDSIYKVENSKKYPFGIKSIDTNGDYAKARKICLNTVNNNYIRWQKDGSKGFYLDYLADKYCPISADKQGNKNWKKNIRAISGMEF